MDKQDRKPNGQFAPKGTGDQTGGKKWENPTEKVASRNKEYKPKVDALEKEWDKLYHDFFYAEPSKRAELQKKLDDLDKKIQDTIAEWEGKNGKKEIEDWEIGETVNDMEWAILPDETVEQVAEQASKKLKVPKERVLALLTKESKAKPSDKYWDTADDFSKGLNKGFKEL